MFLASLIAHSGSDGSSDSHIDLQAGMRQHGDEGIHIETLDLATHEVADPRLGYAEALSGAFLGKCFS